MSSESEEYACEELVPSEDDDQPTSGSTHIQLPPQQQSFQLSRASIHAHSSHPHSHSTASASDVLLHARQQGTTLMEVADRMCLLWRGRAVELEGMLYEAQHEAQSAWHSLEQCNAELAAQRGAADRSNHLKAELLDARLQAGSATEEAKKAAEALQRAQGELDRLREELQTTKERHEGQLKHVHEKAEAKAAEAAAATARIEEVQCALEGARQAEIQKSEEAAIERQQAVAARDTEAERAAAALHELWECQAQLEARDTELLVSTDAQAELQAQLQTAHDQVEDLSGQAIALEQRVDEESSRATEAEHLLQTLQHQLEAAERAAAAQSQRARTAEQAVQQHSQRALLAEQRAEQLAHSESLAKDEVQQLRGQVQCLSGQDNALENQSLAGLLSIEALLEASLQRIRAAVTRVRLQAARNEAMTEAARASSSAPPPVRVAPTLTPPSPCFHAVLQSPSSQCTHGASTAGPSTPAQQQPAHPSTSRSTAPSRPVARRLEDAFQSSTGSSRSRVVPAPAQQQQQQQPPLRQQQHAAKPASRTGQQETSDDNICSICWVRKQNTVLNCGHLFCSACSLKLAKCAFCRSEITSRAVFLFEHCVSVAAWTATLKLSHVVS